MFTKALDNVIKIGACTFSDLMQIITVLSVPNNMLIDPFILSRLLWCGLALDQPNLVQWAQ